MPEVLVSTPLKYSAVTRPYVFADGISIRELSPILWDISIVKDYVSADDKAEMEKVKYWLCASQEYEYGSSDPGKELFTKARHAAWALQIICPSGGMNIFLKFEKTASGYDNIGTERPQQLCQTFLGNLISAEKTGLEKDFDAVYSGISRAFAEGVVRLQNPILLIEQGMQTGHASLATLMFVMGMDMLFMAGEIGNFMKRVGGFLGVGSFVFPPLSILDVRPNTVVGEVLNDVYEFRNIIAHGQEIPKTPFRLRNDILDIDGQRINYEDLCRVDLLLECSLFMLTTALKKIFVDGLFDEVRDTEKWRTKMRLYENRYKDANGPQANKQRGR